MPYIDIVNEILESYVASGLQPDAAAARDSGESTAAELDANPQFVDHRAYQILDQAVYPFTLPFNRPLLVARSYLGQLGASRYEVLHTFHKDLVSPTVRHLLAAEFLGIGAEEFQILTGHAFDPRKESHPHPLAEFYGSPRAPRPSVSRARPSTRRRPRSSEQGCRGSCPPGQALATRTSCPTMNARFAAS